MSALCRQAGPEIGAATGRQTMTHGLGRKMRSWGVHCRGSIGAVVHGARTSGWESEVTDWRGTTGSNSSESLSASAMALMSRLDGPFLLRRSRCPSAAEIGLAQRALHAVESRLRSARLYTEKMSVDTYLYRTMKYWLSGSFGITMEFSKYLFDNLSDVTSFAITWRQSDTTVHMAEMAAIFCLRHTLIVNMDPNSESRWPARERGGVRNHRAASMSSSGTPAQ